MLEQKPSVDEVKAVLRNRITQDVMTPEHDVPAPGIEPPIVEIGG